MKLKPSCIPNVCVKLVRTPKVLLLFFCYCCSLFNIISFCLRSSSSSLPFFISYLIYYRPINTFSIFCRPLFNPPRMQTNWNKTKKKRRMKTHTHTNTKEIVYAFNTFGAPCAHKFGLAWEYLPYRYFMPWLIQRSTQDYWLRKQRKKEKDTQHSDGIVIVYDPHRYKPFYILCNSFLLPFCSRNSLKCSWHSVN